MLLILVEVSAKVSCRSMTATDCGYRAITMLLILMEVSVKVACRSVTATDCRHRAITMLLILRNLKNMQYQFQFYNGY